MPGTDSSDFAVYLPEYVAECDEHLTAAGRVLLELETTVDRPRPEQLDDLFRNFHTIKGLSGMVGVREAERLAHQLEHYLGTVRKGQVTLSLAGVEALIAGVQLLEQVIAARRDDQPIPDVDPLIDRVAGLKSEPSETPPTTPLSGVAKADAFVRRGGRAWRVTFVPSAELATQGVNVNTVRERLQQAGEIVHVEPLVIPGGGVSFRFLLIGTGNDLAVTGDGLTVEPYVPDVPNEPGPIRSASPLTAASLVRVDLGRLDDLMRTVGELVISRARLDNGIRRVAASLPSREWRELQDASQLIERQLRDLREGVMRVRLVPIRDIFARMQFVVRDLSRETGKEVGLELTGEATEIDKFVVERLADPLLHLVRNAVSHGLELPAERVAVGKPSRGRIDLRAAAAGGAVVVEVEDDGRGIDAEQVYARARESNLIPPNTPTDPAGVLDLICIPAFSTRTTADHTSGRGFGMDVVRRAVEDLGGDLGMISQRGRGTRFTARLPLTLAIADALIIEVGGQAYAVPQAAVREVVQIELGATITLENNELIRHRGGVLPLLRLTELFGTASATGTFPALVVGDGQPIALAADRILGLREIVVRPLADPLVQVAGLAGATELGDGRAVLILDAIGLTRLARHRRRTVA